MLKTASSANGVVEILDGQGEMNGGASDKERLDAMETNQLVQGMDPPDGNDDATALSALLHMVLIPRELFNQMKEDGGVSHSEND